MASGQRRHGLQYARPFDPVIHFIIHNKMNELGLEHFNIELFENYQWNSKEELAHSEGEVIRNIGNLNHAIAGRTKTDYITEGKNKD